MNLSHQQRTDCPDWSRLVAQREERREDHRGAMNDDPPGWREALHHFDSCPHCRPQALAADATLLFRRLPGSAQPGEAPRGAQIAVDIEAMQRAVATLRRTVPLQKATVAKDSRGLWRRLSAVAAGLVFVAFLSMTSGVGDQREVMEAVQAETAAEETVVAGEDSLYRAAGFGDELQPFALGDSAIEDVDLPNSRVYQISGKEMTIVTVVNASLDV